MKFSKQSEKFLAKCDVKTVNKITVAISNRANFKKLAPVGNNSGERYRVKVEHYRAIIRIDVKEYYVECIDTKSNMKGKKYGYFG